MMLRRVPPAILIALGLADCGPQVDGESASGSGGDDETSFDPCLIAPLDTTVSTSTSATSTTSTTITSGCLDVGPCLSESEAGPCLGMEPDSSTGGSDSGSGSGSSGGSGSDSGSDSGSTGGTGGAAVPGPGSAAPEPRGSAAPEPRGSRAWLEALDRVERSGALPDDVVARLRDRGGR